MPEKMSEAERCETLRNARDELRREAVTLPNAKPLFIWAAFAVAAIFSALLAAMIVGMLQGKGAPSGGRGGGMGQLLGFLFFLMPIVLTLRYGFNRLKARRRLKQLIRAEKQLTEKIDACAPEHLPD